MSNSTYSILFLVALGGGGALALLRAAPDAPVSVSPAASVASAPTVAPAPMATGVAAPILAAADEPAAITWTAPLEWKSLPNPTSIRLATYAVPGAGDDELADVSVARAGGGTEANIDRWLRQFDHAGREKRSERRVRGLNVVVVEVSGTYLGNATMPVNGSPESANQKPSWSLLGAVVETRGSSYFFKMTGPTATVLRARAAFDALVASVTPAASTTE